jgi:MFS family permease
LWRAFPGREKLARVSGLRARVAESLAALGAVFRNADLRRLELAWAASNIGAWAYGVAVYVYAFHQGGVTAVGAIAGIRVLLTALAAPFLSLLADRFRRKAVMVVCDLVRVVVLGAAAAVVFAGAPSMVVYVLAVIVSIAGAAFRPAQAAALPGLADDVEDLTAANVAASTIESVGIFVGPALGGLLLAASSTGVVFAVTAGAFLLSALLIVRIEKPEAPHERGAEAPGILRGAFGGFETVARDPNARLIVGLVAAQTLVSGALNVLVVVIALDLVDLGNAGVGLLNSAIGIGGLLGALALLGQARRHAWRLALGILLWGLPLVVVGAWPNRALALVLLGVVGVGNTLVDVSALTLLQRGISNNVLARVFGVLESLCLGAVALGAALVPVLIHAFGVRATLIVAGAFLPAVTALTWRQILALDHETPERRRELELLRGISLFAPLPELTLESIAAQLVPSRFETGEPVVREGEPGDRFYVVDDGELAVTAAGRPLRRLGPGDHFGEIALLRSVPRTATVTASAPVKVFALDRDAFVGVVTGHAESAAAADAVIATRLGSLRPNVASL